MMSPPPSKSVKPALAAGFTLIEIAIVLVIIGLIVGGVLVGQSLINAAAVRATITQIEKYNTAVNTFRTRYNNQLPGDIDAADAAQFGFAARGQYAGEGDGNGVIEGINSNAAGQNCGNLEGAGESTMFWVDLSTAGLIDGTFNTASPTTPPGINVYAYTTPAISAFFPEAKLGGGNYVYVWSGGIGSVPPFPCSGGNGSNYFGVSAVNRIAFTNINSTPGMTVQQAYSIDTKIDDGYPQTGRVSALYLTHTAGGNGWIVWAAGGGVSGPSGTSATPGSATTCYDNGGVSGPQQYSVEQNGGAGLNCALSFQFQ